VSETEREPVVMPPVNVPDGCIRDVPVQSGANRVTVRLKARGGFLAIGGDLSGPQPELAELTLELQPDPVAAAVLKRDERAKCAVYQVLHDKPYAVDCINEIYAAIDAPPETVSESGAEYAEYFARKFEERLCQIKRNYAPDSRAFRIYEEIQVELRDFPVTEPTP
jgi:hypothetical protein